MIVCGNVLCQESFCYSCVKKNINSIDQYNKFKNNPELRQNWVCFICKETCICNSCQGSKENINEPIIEDLKAKPKSNIITIPNLAFASNPAPNQENVVKIEDYLFIEKEGPENESEMNDDEIVKGNNVKQLNRNEAQKMISAVERVEYLSYTTNAPKNILKKCVSCDRSDLFNNELLKFKTIDDFYYYFKFIFEKRAMNIISNPEFFEKNKIYFNELSVTLTKMLKLTLKSVKYLCKNCLVLKLNEQEGLNHIYTAMEIPIVLQNFLANNPNIMNTNLSSPKQNKTGDNVKRADSGKIKQQEDFLFGQLNDNKPMINNPNFPKEDVGLGLSGENPIPEGLKSNPNAQSDNNPLKMLMNQMPTNMQQLFESGLGSGVGNIGETGGVNPANLGMNLNNLTNNLNNMSNMMGNKSTGQINPSNLNNIVNNFNKIVEGISSFNNKHISHNQNLVNNVSNLTGMLSNYFNENENNKQENVEAAEEKDKSQKTESIKSQEKKEDKPNQNGEVEKKDDGTSIMNIVLNVDQNKNPVLSYMMNVLEDLKKQIVCIQYYSLLQKLFISYIFKNLEMFMEQVSSNQNLSDLPKGGQMGGLGSVPQFPFMGGIPNIPNIPGMPPMPKMLENLNQAGMGFSMNQGGMPNLNEMMKKLSGVGQGGMSGSSDEVKSNSGGMPNPMEMIMKSLNTQNQQNQGANMNKVPGMMSSGLSNNSNMNSNNSNNHHNQSNASNNGANMNNNKSQQHNTQQNQSQNMLLEQLLKRGGMGGMPGMSNIPGGSGMNHMSGMPNMPGMPNMSSMQNMNANSMQNNPLLGMMGNPNLGFGSNNNQGLGNMNPLSFPPQSNPMLQSFMQNQNQNMQSNMSSTAPNSSHNPFFNHFQGMNNNMMSSQMNHLLQGMNPNQKSSFNSQANSQQMPFNLMGMFSQQQGNSLENNNNNNSQENQMNYHNQNMQQGENEKFMGLNNMSNMSSINNMNMQNLNSMPNVPNMNMSQEQLYQMMFKQHMPKQGGGNIQF